jgi:hypothetical protein
MAITMNLNPRSMGWFARSAFLSICLFLVIDFSMPPADCWDCLPRRGWPFAYYHREFGDEGVFEWMAMAGDAFVVMTLSAILAWAWARWRKP